MTEGIAWAGPFDDNINWDEGWGHEEIEEVAVEESEWKFRTCWPRS